MYNFCLPYIQIAKAFHTQLTIYDNPSIGKHWRTTENNSKVSDLHKRNNPEGGLYKEIETYNKRLFFVFFF